MNDLVVGSLAGGWECAEPVHPSPEVLCARHNVSRDGVQDVVELIVRGVGGKIGMLVIGSDLEQRITFAIGCSGLANQTLVRDKCP